MVDFSLDRPGDHNYVRSIGDAGICIAGQYYSGPLLLSADAVDTGWPPESMGELQAVHLEAIFALRPEVALLGTGPIHRLLPRALLVEVYRLGGALEVMSTDAACRTFNVLVSDGRKVVAGLMPL